MFRGKWYNIKQLIGIAKEAKLKNSAPIKYHIEVGAKYWESIFRAEGITDRRKQQARIVAEKQQILDFLTGAENSGKAWFSTFYVTPNGKEQHDVVINKIDDSKEGGDLETDIQEAINMICFTMRVHSNLVGSVPGKAQSNNSDSDKRELYTIAQALQKPYHDLLFTVHRIIIRFNGWQGVTVDVPFIQLTTLDEHQDAKQVKLRPQVIDLEASLAEEWFSPELMSALRSENLRGDLTEKRSEIVRQVKAQVVGYLRSGSFNSRRLADIGKALKNNKIVNEVNILWRLVAVGNG